MFKENLENYISRLKEYSDFEYGTDDEEINYTYEHSQELEGLIEKYDLEKLIDSNDEIVTFINLMSWVHNIMKHDGEFTTKPEVLNTSSIIESGKKHGSNCLYMSIVLSELYLACGFKSRYVRCLPYDHRDVDCHVVTSVYSKTLDKWVMMDPTTEGYVKDEKGKLLSLKEFREALVNDEKLYLNDEINWNGEKFEDEEYIGYMAKNLFRFDSLQVNCYGAEELEDKRWIAFAPIGFDSCQTGIKNAKWMNENYDQIDEEFVENMSDKLLNRTTFTSDEKLFWEL